MPKKPAANKDTTIKQGTTKNSNQLTAILLIVSTLLTLSLVLLSSQLSSQKKANAKLEFTRFRDQLNEGKACGVITTKEARMFIGEGAVNGGASIVPSTSPTAATRGGSPRVDGCTYVLPESNGSYLDVVIKTYDSVESAKSNYMTDTNKIMYIEDRPLPVGSSVTCLRYSSGAHYMLLFNEVIEVSASKVGASAGAKQEQFSRDVVDYILDKL